MIKKYQVFISSTYKDLVEERKAVRDAILKLYQFPIGMEMFSADDEEQWEVIKETIDTSDIYVLLIGHRYGSVIQNGPDAGISYTEKEFKYAISKGIPTLVFIISDSAPILRENIETDNLDKLKKFKELASTGRMVEWWDNPDDLAHRVSAAISKKIFSGKLTGWMRSDEFDLEKSHSELIQLSDEVRNLRADNERLIALLSAHQEPKREPCVRVSFNLNDDMDEDYSDEAAEVTMNDIDKDELITSITIPYKSIQRDGYFPRFVHMTLDDVPDELKELITQEEIDIYNNALPSAEDIRKYDEDMFFYKQVSENRYDIAFYLFNEGTSKATDVNITIDIPDGLVVMERNAIDGLAEPKRPILPQDPIEKAWIKKKYPYIEKSKNLLSSIMTEPYKKYEFDPSRIMSALPSLSNFSSGYSCDIKNNVITVWSKDIQHTYGILCDECCLIPIRPGKYEIKCTIMCDEYIDQKEQSIWVEVV